MLQWLFDQVINIWNRLTTIYNDIITWAKYEAGKALEKAKRFVNDAIYWIKVHLTNLINGVRNIAYNLYQQAITFANNVFGRAVAAAQALVDGVAAIARWLFNKAIAFALDVYNRAVTAARQLVWIVSYEARKLFESVLAFAAGVFDRAVATARIIVQGVADIFNAIVARIDSDIQKIRDNLGQNDPTMRSNLLSFLSNPLSFIVALLIDWILIILEWALAYALGTTKYDLPPRPDWSTTGVGGTVVVGSSPPPTASGLVPPLSHLRVSGYSFRTGHPGLDLGLSIGTPVFAMHSGRILFAGWDSVNYGLTVVIQGGEWWTRYAHLSQILVGVGQNVNAGYTIGLGGSTGNSTGPHLHLEIKHNGRFIDPTTVL